MTDDGRGPDGAAVRQAAGHGLIGIQERVAACGGHAEMGLAPGGGFRVIARLPYTETDATGARVPSAASPDDRPRNAGTP